MLGTPRRAGCSLYAVLSASGAAEEDGGSREEIDEILELMLEVDRRPAVRGCTRQSKATEDALEKPYPQRSRPSKVTGWNEAQSRPT